jgi:Na+-transporting methylmalonyl-CoA/oxaloacetate decarboxylase gamma subunit
MYKILKVGIVVLYLSLLMLKICGCSNSVQDFSVDYLKGKALEGGVLV